MNILVVLAHPSVKSFNHAIAKAVADKLKRNNHDVVFLDLYREKFDPLLSEDELKKNCDPESLIKVHCEYLVIAEGLIFIHPNWWGQPPAILKGWIDRVFRPGVAYGFNEGDCGEGVPEGLLKGKIAVVFNTSDTSPEREKNIFGDPLDLIWKKCLFEFCGITTYFRKTYGIVVTSTAEERRAWLEDVKETVNRYFP